MIILDKDSKNHKVRIVLTPNRSISWKLLFRFYLLTCVLSFSIAVLFAAMGYWMVLPFSGLEMLVFGAGLYVACRKVYQQEVISLHDGVVKIEKGCISVEKEWRFDSCWVQINLEKSDGYNNNLVVKMGSHGNFIEVGSFLNDKEKERLAFELNQSILTNDFLGHAG